MTKEYVELKKPLLNQLVEWAKNKLESSDSSRELRHILEEQDTDFFDVDIFGKVAVIYDGNKLGDHETYLMVFYSPKLDLYFGLSGWYSSYDGADFENEIYLFELCQEVVTMYDYCS
jgi:hypothetical protein